MRDQGCSMAEIARSLGVKKSRVANWFRSGNHEAHAKHTRGNMIYSPEVIGQIRDTFLTERRKSKCGAYLRTAQRLGITEQRVRRGLAKAFRAGCRDPLMPTPSATSLEIKAALAEHGGGHGVITHVLSKMKTTETTVRRIADSMGIPWRRPEPAARAARPLVPPQSWELQRGEKTRRLPEPIDHMWVTSQGRFWSGKGGGRWLKFSMRDRRSEGKGRRPRITLPARDGTGIWAVGPHIVVWLAFRGELLPGQQIDHVNGNPRDNRLSNLQPLYGEDNARKGGAKKTAALAGRIPFSVLRTMIATSACGQMDLEPLDLTSMGFGPPSGGRHGKRTTQRGRAGKEENATTRED